MATAVNPPSPAVNAPSPADLAPSDLDADDQTLLGPAVQWSEDTVKTIHRVVYEETMRARVSPQFLPHHKVPAKTVSHPPGVVVSSQLDPPISLPSASTTSGSSSTVTSTPPQAPLQITFTIDEGATIRLVEIAVEFALTDQQVAETREATNAENTTVVALARKTAQYLALAVDSVVHQGWPVFSSNFFQTSVRSRAGQLPLDGGLLGLTLGPNLSATLPYSIFYGPTPGGASAAGAPTAQNATNPFFMPNNPIQPIIVPPLSYTETNFNAALGLAYGQNTLTAVTQGISNLRAIGNVGPFALILHPFVHADLFAPVGDSLVITADRVIPFVPAGLYPTQALPSYVAPTPSGGSPPSVTATNGASWYSFFQSNSAVLQTDANDTSTPPAGLVLPTSTTAVPVLPPIAHAGVLCSLGGHAVDLIVGQHARTRWQQKDPNGNHRFRVLDRFAVRITDPTSVQPLVFIGG